MAINYEQYPPEHNLLYINQMRRSKNSKFRHPKLFHAFMGTVFVGVFLGLFNDVEDNLTAKFNFLENNIRPDVIYDIPNLTSLSQKHGKSAYDIEGDIGQKNKFIIRINRTNKRDNTYLINRERQILLAEKKLQAERSAQIERITKQARLNEQLAEQKAQSAIKQQKQALLDKKLNTELKQKLAVKKVAPIVIANIRTYNITKSNVIKNGDLKSNNQTANIAEGENIAIIPPMNSDEKQADDSKKQMQIASLTPISELKPTQILSDAEIASLKAEVNKQIEMNMSEQDAPMPAVHSGTLKSEAVDLLLAQATAKAHETEADWVAEKAIKPVTKAIKGSGKTSSIKRQIANVAKISPITIVKGKIATKEFEGTVDEIRMARVNVPAPLKRPKYVPKRRAISSVQTSGRTTLTCLTTALYHEVRGESRSGQLAVAEVILARKKSRSYPNSICGVIYQNAHRRNACQFSFACDGKTDLPRDLKTWAKMKRLAGDFLAGRAGQRSVRGATHYHATYVSPKWRWAMRRITRIGTHIFYKDPKARS